MSTNYNPTPTESRESFIDRFVNIPVMIDEFPNLEQRTAVANLAWEQSTPDEDEITNFPNVGDNKKVSLKNSKFNQFDYTYAKNIKDNFKRIWSKGGNEFGNQAFTNWGRVRNRSPSEFTKSDKEWIIRRERFMERHSGNKNISGVVTVMKWGGIVSDGVSFMKNLINEEKKKEKKEVEMPKQYQKNLGILQKAQIIDEENRIIRVKASDGDYDRDDDRINPQGWKMPGYNPPLADSHKTADTADRRLGEVIRGFYQDGFYWNDIQLDKPTGDAKEWTDGEKLANRIWKNALEGKDIRFSVGFLPNANKMKRNEKGGIDFGEQEQTELSVVLMPSNARAGNKQAGDITTDVSISETLRLKLQELYNKGIGLCVCDIYIGYLIFNSFGEDEDGVYYDKYYKLGYAVTGNDVELIGQAEEVVPTRAWVSKSAGYKTKNKSIDFEINITNKDVIETFFKEIAEKAEVINKSLNISNDIEQQTAETDIVDNEKTIDVEAIVNKSISEKFNKK